MRLTSSYLSKRRKQLKLTQEDIGNRMGYTKQNISLYENDNKKIEYYTAILDAYELDVVPREKYKGVDTILEGLLEHTCWVDAWREDPRCWSIVRTKLEEALLWARRSEEKWKEDNEE